MTDKHPIIPPEELVEQWLEKARPLLRIKWRSCVPKPLSLKEQALADLDTIQTHDPYGHQIADLSTIRRAIEALPND
jgi:hypothetical protein